MYRRFNMFNFRKFFGSFSKRGIVKKLGMHLTHSSLLEKRLSAPQVVPDVFSQTLALLIVENVVPEVGHLQKTLNETDKSFNYQD